ncbi:hypothetical protein EKO04_008907 [Ascochyta lentis]|uniref:Arabinan endo-1,5-alpha-L-arabinosidase n=1 Tax=Ascochyta lentis TaxID=205686 RepID=A0A8H7IY94_9PLEO|nr:hypothetical protein EKO04_008907 [Ascochyta lentis]
MGVSSLVTLATFLALLFRFGLTSPVPQGDTNYYPSLYPEPSPCVGNCSHIHDPSIFYEDGTYWRFSTSGNIAVATTSSLKGPWKYKGSALTEGTKINIAPDQDIWAPSISKFEETYYIHYSVSTMGSQRSQIGLATSLSLAGPWTDHGSLNLPLSDTYNLIDPSVFQESPSDPIYFTFGSYWQGIHQFTLPSSSHLTAFDGTMEAIRPLVTNSTASAAVVEGGITWKHDTEYYLFFSVGACCNTPTTAPYLLPPGDEYHVAVCRADAVTGPYFDRAGKDCQTQSGGTTILASHGNVYAPGGQGIMTVEGGRDVIYYHYVKPSVGYEADQFYFGWNFLEWRDGWPVVV